MSTYDYAKPYLKRSTNVVLTRLPNRMRSRIKEYFELRFWKDVHAQVDRSSDVDKTLEHERSHYEEFYTSFFALNKSDFTGKCILDIGCGPMGSLEWADNALERVGLDPLADQYKSMGANRHSMTYVNAFSESIPFNDSHFDYVASLNSLDHVEDIKRTVAEIIRVLKPGGTTLIITEIDHIPTLTEPHQLTRSVLELFRPTCSVLSEKLYGVRHDHNLYAGLREQLPYIQGQPGLLCAKLVKRL